MNLTVLLGEIGLAAAAVCLGAYVYSFVFKIRGFRPLSVLSLFSTVVAMAQLSVMLTGQGGRLNATYAMAFLLISGLAQALSALKFRPSRLGLKTRETDADDEDDD